MKLKAFAKVHFVYMTSFTFFDVIGRLYHDEQK